MGSNSYVDLSVVHPHPANVREDLGDLTELADSIRQQGLLQPLLIQPHPDKAGQFRLLAGHRRYAAARLAGLESVPVVLRHGVDDVQALELMLVENCQRRELGPMEKAEAMGALVHRGHTAADVARKTGLTDSTVSYYLTLLELEEASRDKVRTGELSAADAVTAVRRTRKNARRRADRQAQHDGSTDGKGGDRKGGSKKNPNARWEWEPDFLTGTHPLARKAERLCEAREHTMRRRIGKIACGQCWESVIREDERVVTATLTEQPTSQPFTEPPSKPGAGRTSLVGVA